MVDHRVDGHNCRLDLGGVSHELEEHFGYSDFLLPEGIIDEFVEEDIRGTESCNSLVEDFLDEGAPDFVLGDHFDELSEQEVADLLGRLLPLLLDGLDTDREALLKHGPALAWELPIEQLVSVRVEDKGEELHLVEGCGGLGGLHFGDHIIHGGVYFSEGVDALVGADARGDGEDELDEGPGEEVVLLGDELGELDDPLGNLGDLKMRIRALWVVWRSSR